MTITALTIGFLAFWWLGRIGFGTFIVDPAMLFILGYFVTQAIYKYLTPRIKISAVRRFFVLLFPLTLISLWLGGILPYLNLVNSSDIYFGLLPQWLVGPSEGNDFMWNGLGIQFLFGDLVPAPLIPTYHYLGFNILAALIWIAYLPILGWGVLEGQAAALITDCRFSRLIREWLRIIAIGIGLSLTVSALTALVVQICL